MRRPFVTLLAIGACALIAPLTPSQDRGAETTAGPRAVVGEPRSQPVSGSALEARTREVAALLRCPVCQGLSVADSPATMAQKMKDEVREMVAAGYDQDQILTYFERSYGEFVRLKPPLRGVNWLVWLSPGLGLVLGLAIVWAALRARGATRGSTDAAQGTPGPDTLPEDPQLAAYVLKARELAYGWAGGRQPGSEEGR
jgi:cytochrome c-type biogenesis protein CcmH